METMKRISVTIPEEVAEALEQIIRLAPSKPSRSEIITAALALYLAQRYPALFSRKAGKGPSVLAALKSVRPRAPSPTLRRCRLRIPRWAEVEG